MGKRVLVLSNMYPSPSDRSYGKFVQVCVNGLVASGCEVDVVGVARQTSMITKFLAYLCFSVKANFRLLTRSYDCVYIHHPLHTLIAACPAVLMHSGKVALNFHGHDLIPVTRRGEYLQRLVSAFFSKAATVVVPSEHFRKVFQSLYPRQYRSEPRVFYSGGVAEPYFATSPVPIRDRPSSALFLSRLVVDKGWPEFLNIAQRLRQANARMTFTIAGIGPDAGEIRDEIVRAGVGEWVALVESSTISSNLELYNKHRYFIFPTRFDESLALVNLEAMARGCVVFSADFPTAAEYIEQAGNGYRFNLANFEQQVSDEILQLEADPERAERIAAQARNDALKFRESVIMERLPVVLGV